MTDTKIPTEEREPDYTALLAEPFDPSFVKWKPQVISGNRAMAIAYIDARLVQDRLDEVLGVGGWQDDYEALPDGSVICRLKIFLNGKWIHKADVGGQSEQPDGGDRMKAAFSDALKRAAVKFGVGRYLYRLPHQWVDWDAQKRQFLQTPKLPAFAMPGSNPPVAQKASASARVAQQPPHSTQNGRTIHTLPATGKELRERLNEYDMKLATQGVIARGDLLQHIAEVGARAGYGEEMAAWPVTAITLAVDQTKAFESAQRLLRQVISEPQKKNLLSQFPGYPVSEVEKWVRINYKCDLDKLTVQDYQKAMDRVKKSKENQAVESAPPPF